MIAAFVENDSDHAHLVAMWVAPGARNRGVGARLLEAVVRWAATAGLHFVRLDVATANLAARRLYERRGFIPTGRSRRYENRPDLVTSELELRLIDER